MSNDEKGNLIWDTFIGIIHYSKDQSNLFLKIELE